VAYLVVLESVVEWGEYVHTFCNVLGIWAKLHTGGGGASARTGPAAWHVTSAGNSPRSQPAGLWLLGCGCWAV